MHFVDHDKLIAPQVGNACNNLSEKTTMEKDKNCRFTSKIQNLSQVGSAQSLCNATAM